MEQKYFSVMDLAKRYGICRVSVYDRVKSGLLPRGVKIGRSRRWSIEEIENAEKNFVTA